jgi:hypothetical protein
MTTVTIRKEDGAYIVRIFGELFTEVIEELKERIPSYHRRYLPDAKCWRVDSLECLYDWLGQVEDWDGVRVDWVGQRQANYQPPPPPPPRQTPRDAAYTALHLLPTAPPELVKAAHKTLALLHHPDRGGDLRTMQTINSAFDLITKGDTRRRAA